MLGLALTAPSPAQPETEQKKLTLDRLYSMPRLIGTQPRGFAWSRDSRKLAFLWNDRGTNFYDVWLIQQGEAEPRRVTSLTSGEGPATPVESDEIDLLKSAVAEERDTGVAWLVWHPGGDHILFSFQGRLQIQALSESAMGRRHRTVADRVSRVSFSPDGKYMAYVSRGAIWRLDSSSLLGTSGDDDLPKPVPLMAEPPEGVRTESYSWSPDSRRIAFIQNDSSDLPRQAIPDYLTVPASIRQVRRPFPGDQTARRRLGIYDLKTGETAWAEVLRQPEDLIFSFRWSPDSGRLLVDTSDFLLRSRRILSVDVAGGRITHWFSQDDPKNSSAGWSSDWSPSGDSIYVVTDLGWDYHLYKVDVPEATPRALTSGKWAIQSFQIAPTQQSIYLISNEGRPEERHIFRIGLEGGKPQRISVRPGTHRPTFSPDGSRAAVHFSSDTTPYDLLMTQLDPSIEDREKQMTSSPLSEFYEYRWVEPRYVTFPSRVDESELHGRLTLPPDFDPGKRYPAILGSVYANTVRNQWGGRTSHPTWGLDQYLAQEGYVLLNVDMRGSWGHGKAFRQGLFKDYGGIDVEDLHSGVEYLATTGYVDMERVGIWGSSYGGLMTCMSLFRKPGVFRAGIAGAPATNVWHAFPEQMWVMGPPDKNAAEFLDSSAFSHSGGLEDPLMIIHGMRDSVVLFQDSVNLVQRLLLQGKDVDLVVLPDSGHGWDNEGLYQTRFAFRKMVAFFDRHLKGE